MQTWEYKLYSISTSGDVVPRERVLNDLGQQGWKLVAVLPIFNSLGEASGGASLYFMRPLN